jgi:hypothetical protein
VAKYAAAYATVKCHGMWSQDSSDEARDAGPSYKPRHVSPLPSNYRKLSSHFLTVSAHRDTVEKAFSIVNDWTPQESLAYGKEEDCVNQVLSIVLRCHYTTQTTRTIEYTNQNAKSSLLDIPIRL